jgi:alkaline phosphatase D
MNRRPLLALVPLAFLCLAADDPQTPIRRIVFGSNLDPQKSTALWNAMAAADPDLLILAGDNIRPAGADAESLKAAYGQLAELAPFKKLKQTCPVLVTWNEREIGSDLAASQQAFLDFLEVPKDAPVRSRKGMYRAVTIGPAEKSVQVILLDTRTFRTPQPHNKSGTYDRVWDETITMLGEPQWQWLETELKKPATLRILVSGTPIVDGDHGADTWAVYLHERDRLFRLLRETKAEGTFIVSGDRHHSGYAAMLSELKSPLIDLTAGVVDDAKSDKHYFPGRPEVKAIGSGRNCCGVIVVDWDKTDPAIHLQLVDDEGAKVLEEKLSRKQLSANSMPNGTFAAIVKDVAATADDEPSGVLKIDGKAVDAKQIGALVGKEITLDMKVVGTGKNKTGTMIFLNSADRKSPDNFTVLIDKKGVESLKKAGVADPAMTYKTQTVRVVGVVTSFQDRHEIVISDAAKIKLVEREKQ